MRRLIGFIKKHPWFALCVSPVILMVLMAVLGWSAVFVFPRTGIEPNVLSQSLSGTFFILLLLSSLIYPLILTGCNLYFIYKRELSLFESRVNILTEAATIMAGTFLSWIYVPEAADISFADWPEVLYNNQVHTPIATWTIPTVIALSAAGVLGYLILRAVPLKKMPPLVAVLSISAMYIGCMMCLFWIVQTMQPGRGGVYLYLFPVNCILIAVKVIRRHIWQWQELHPDDRRADGMDGEWAGAGNEKAGKAEAGNEKAGKAEAGKEKAGNEMDESVSTESSKRALRIMKRVLNDSSNWPWLAFLLMVPLLGILLMILTLLGQEPDSIIKAWTQTSQWTLSQKISPQNLSYDEHYLCTAAAGGHPKIVKPIRRGVRHGHEVTVNRQLCVANAFEQILEERLPRLHRIVRDAYDRYGYPVARHVKSPLAADALYIGMKPLEWFFLAVIYLCDPKPENRISMQYITPIRQEGIS